MQDYSNQKTISAKQMMYAVGLFIIASNLLTKDSYRFTKNQTWVAVLIATAMCLVVVSVYGKLAKDYPGCHLFDINKAVFGVILGKLFSATYLFYFLSLTVFNSRDLGEFVHSAVLPTTPLNLIYAAFLIICVYAVKKGAGKITQYATLILYIYLILLLFIASLLIPQMHLQNFLPVFTIPVKDIMISTHSLAMLPFGEILVFMTMTHYMLKPEETGKALRRGLILGAAATLFLVLRVIAVLGDYSLVSSSPTFNLIRLIDVGGILTRLEIINAVLQITLFYFKTTILLYATVLGIGHLFNTGKTEIFALVTGVFIIVCANLFFNSSSEHRQWFRAAATYSTFFLYILPIATFFVSEFKRRREKNLVRRKDIKNS